MVSVQGAVEANQRQRVPQDALQGTRVGFVRVVQIDGHAVGCRMQARRTKLNCPSSPHDLCNAADSDLTRRLSELSHIPFLGRLSPAHY